MAVHDVDVDPVRPGVLGRADLLGQPAEVGGENRRGDLDVRCGPGRCPSWGQGRTSWINRLSM